MKVILFVHVSIVVIIPVLAAAFANIVHSFLMPWLHVK